MDIKEILSTLRAACDLAGSQTAWARANGFSPAYICETLAGKKQVSERLAAALGVERVVVYRARSSGIRLDSAGTEPESG